MTEPGDGDARAQLAARVVERLQVLPSPAAFAIELVSQLSVGAAELDEALAQLESAATISVYHHPAPDRHLAAVDLRVVATGPDRDQAAEAAWAEWLKNFASAHRCE